MADANLVVNPSAPAVYSLRTLKNPNAIPRELWQYPQFVCWKYVDRGPGHKPDKVPINPKTLGNAGIGWPNTRADIRPTVKTYQEHNDLNGIGFVLIDGDPYVMVDLDDCVTDDSLSVYAQAIVESLNTYTEISPSGHGLRLLVHCRNQPQAIKRDEIEIYSKERFCTLTGNILNSTPIAKFDDLDWFIDRFVPQAKEEKQNPAFSSRVQHNPPTPDDQGLWERIRHFNRLADDLYQGKLSQVGGDKSMAVIMLLNCLARWTNRDKARMERMIKMTALNQTKFDDKRGGRTWLQMQIEYAIKHEAGNL